MTDKQTLAAMLNRAGVLYVEEENRIEIGTEGPRNEGYSMFMAEFIFDDLGNLERTGVWE
jgi:hypothetical protein